MEKKKHQVQRIPRCCLFLFPLSSGHCHYLSSSNPWMGSLHSFLLLAASRSLKSRLLLLMSTHTAETASREKQRRKQQTPLFVQDFAVYPWAFFVVPFSLPFFLSLLILVDSQREVNVNGQFGGNKRKPHGKPWKLITQQQQQQQQAWKEIKKKKTFTF